MIKCPHCGGELTYLPGTEIVKCDYCGSEFSAEEIDNYREVDAAEYQEKSWKDDSTIEATVFTCPQCGGEIYSLDQSAAKIVDTVKRTGAKVSGPVPLPTKKEIVTILRAVHKYKDSREQFEQRTHKRLIDVLTPTDKTVDALSRLEMPAGVHIDIRMKTK